MPLGGTKDEHFSCFHSSCQLRLKKYFWGQEKIWYLYCIFTSTTPQVRTLVCRISWVLGTYPEWEIRLALDKKYEAQSDNWYSLDWLKASWTPIKFKCSLILKHIGIYFKTTCQTRCQVTLSDLNCRTQLYFLLKKVWFIQSNRFLVRLGLTCVRVDKNYAHLLTIILIFDP